MWKIGETTNWSESITGNLWYNKVRDDIGYYVIAWAYEVPWYERYFYTGTINIVVADGGGDGLLSLQLWAVGGQSEIDFEALWPGGEENAPGDYGWEAYTNYINPACKDAWVDYHYKLSDDSSTTLAEGYVRVPAGEFSAAVSQACGELWGNLTADISKQFEFSITGTSEEYGDIEYIDRDNVNLNSKPWVKHWIDNDPCYLPPNRFWHGYKCSGGRAQLKIDGTQVFDVALPSSFASAWNVPRYYIYINTGDYSEVSGAGPSDKKCLDISLPTGLDDQVVTYYYGEGTAESHMSYLRVDGATIELWSNANEITSSYTVTQLAYNYDVNMSATGRYLDGSPLVGNFTVHTPEHPIIGSGSSRTVDTSTNLDFTTPNSLNVEYLGWYHITDGYSPLEHKRCNAYVVTGSPMAGVYQDTGYCTIDDGSLGSLGEPVFADSNPADSVNDAYADRRLLLDVDAPAFGALKMDVAEHTLWTFDDTWTAHNCTITEVAGGIEISNVTTGAYIEKTYDRVTDDTISFQGARFARLDFSTDSTQGLGVVIRHGGGDYQREYSITEAKPRFDLLAPTNKSGVDASTITMVNKILPREVRPDDSPVSYTEPSWGWGVHFPGKVRVTNFDPGKTYTLTTMKLVKAETAEGAFTGIVALPQTNWVGKTAGGNSDVPGTHGPYLAGVVYSESMNPLFTYYAQVVGYWINDGVIAGEIIGGYFVYNHGLGKYTYEIATIGDSVAHCLPAPPNAFITISVLASSSSTTWGNDQFPLHWLDSATSATASVTATASGKADIEARPVNTLPASPGGTFKKVFRGGAMLLFADSDGMYDNVTLRIISDAGINSVDKTKQTNKLGWTLTPAVNQFYAADIEIIDTDDPLSAEIDVMNRTLTPVTLLGLVSNPGGDESDILIDQLTGMGIAGLIAAGTLYIRRTFDAGKTYESPISIANNASKPCIVLDTVGSKRSWGVCWNDSSTVKLAWSNDWFNTTEVQTLMTGISHARAVVHPHTGTMLIAGWRDSDDSIVAAYSDDKGVTVSTPVVVTAAPERAFGLTFAPDSKRTWCISMTDDTGELKTYWSYDDGVTWGLAQ